MEIAFYAPLKSPGHPVPSGDRAMARLLTHALAERGHAVGLASTLRSFCAAPDPGRFADIEAEAEVEIDRISRDWTKAGAGPPQLWFTYHPFYKAPDLIGPCLADRFGLPYVTAEASHAPRRAGGPWHRWHTCNERAIRTGATHFCFTDRDAAGIAGLLGRSDTIVRLKPFIDAAAPPPRSPRRAGPIELVAVAMMRPGDKLRSYEFLARALAALPSHLEWHLSVIGDGPAKAAVHAAFGHVPGGRITWCGLMRPHEVAAALRAADLYVWPGFNEAFGVAYLEAGAAGLPVVALRSGGIASVVEDGRTGCLTEEDDVPAYTAAMGLLIRDGDLRQRLGQAAEAMVRGERDLATAAAILDAGLVTAARPSVPA